MSLPRTTIGRLSVALFAVVISAGTLLVQLGQQPRNAVAAEPVVKAAASLKWIPADASFYDVSLRNKEQFDLVVKSRAWEKFTTMPSVQMAVQFVSMQFQQAGGPAEDVLRFFSNPENHPLFEFLADMVSDEVFIYGDSRSVGTAELLSDAYATLYFESRVYKPLRAVLGLGDDEQPAKVILDMLAEDLERIQVPNVAVGFKVRDTQRAIAQLKRLEAIVQQAAESEPELKKRFQRAKVGGADFLTLTLDGEMVPWEEFPFALYAEKEGQYDKLVAKLKEQKFVIALGLRENFVLLSIGGSTDHLATLGQGPLLADRPEFKPLAPFADRRLVGIGYMSKAMHSIWSSGQKDVDDLVASMMDFLPHTELPPETEKRVRQDLTSLAAEIKKFLPDPGPVLAFTIITPEGLENYTCDWTKGYGLDATKRLSLLDHGGGASLVTYASRIKHRPEEYETYVNCIKTGYKYFEELAVPLMDEETRQKFTEFMKGASPLLERLDKATGKMLLPALADGQASFVLDAKTTARQWHNEMPPAETPLAIPEMAVVLGVSDAELLKKAVSEYFSVTNEMIALLSKLSDGEIPEFTLTPPESRTSGDGTSYWYKLPADWGLDEQIAPNAWLSKNLVVLSLLPKHTDRLQSPKPLTAKGPLADASRPLAAALHVDWAGIVDAVKPWVDYAIHQSMDANADETKFIMNQVQTGFELLKVFRGAASATYVQQDATVTHTLFRIQDVP